MDHAYHVDRLVDERAVNKNWYCYPKNRTGKENNTMDGIKSKATQAQQEDSFFRADRHRAILNNLAIVEDKETVDILHVWQWY